MKSRLVIFILVLVTAAAKGQTITEVYFPRFIQGVGSNNLADERRVPFACRLTVSGLLPNTTYSYYNRFVLDPNNLVSQGEGTVILVNDTGSFVRIPFASMTAGRNGKLTTDSSGAYTGWFVTEPNSTTTYLPGRDIYFRLLLNDGMGGQFIAKRITAPSPVRVLSFGADSASGTGLRARPLAKAAAKQFIFLYDNFEAQGRPFAGTYIESDGTDGSLANGYAPFYADSVNGVNKAFGTIIPNQLPEGLKRMDMFGLTDGAFKRSYFPYPIIESTRPFTIGFRWPSVNNTLIDTRNPNGGLQNVLVIDGSRVLNINFWLSTEASTEEMITLQWNTSAEDQAVEYRIEKSVDGGKTFAAFNTVKKGNKKLVYELKDTRNENTAYYRVIMTAKDRSTITSDVLKVQGVIKLATYPNPVMDQLVVKHTQAEKGTSVQVVSMDGRQLLVQNVKEGAVQTTVIVKNLVTGNYFLVYSSGGRRQSKLFVKQ
jgi:hypothetical protein